MRFAVVLAACTFLCQLLVLHVFDGLQAAANGQNDLLVGEGMAKVSGEATSCLLRGERVTLKVVLSSRSSHMPCAKQSVPTEVQTPNRSGDTSWPWFTL
jgi:hypothetical protein